MGFKDILETILGFVFGIIAIYLVKDFVYINGKPNLLNALGIVLILIVGFILGRVIKGESK